MTLIKLKRLFGQTNIDINIIMITPSTTLLLFQIAAHLSIIPMIMYASLSQWAISLFVYFLTGCLGMTMTYHRLLSHKSWTAPTWLARLFTLFATIGLTGSAISWVAVHRLHHRYVDTDRDPHSPTFKGQFTAHWLSMFAPVHVKYSVDLLRDGFLKFQHNNYFKINLLYGLIIYLIDPMAVVYAWLFPAMILWNGGSSIVSISHRNGNPHDDTALAVMVWGEGYHKHHHDKPGDSRFGKYDLGGLLINVFKK